MSFYMLSHVYNKTNFFRTISPVDLMGPHFAVARMQSNHADSEEPYRPVIDGVEFSQQPLEYFSQLRGQLNKDIILGTTSDEMAFIKLMYEEKKVTKEMFKVRKSPFFAWLQFHSKFVVVYQLYI